MFSTKRIKETILAHTLTYSIKYYLPYRYSIPYNYSLLVVGKPPKATEMKENFVIFTPNLFR